MQQFVQYLPEFEFAVKMGNSLSSFNLTEEEAQMAMEYYRSGNTLDLEKLLASHAPALEPGEVNITDPFDAIAEKPEYGYEATPLHTFVFVKPIAKDHAGRLIVPQAYESQTDMGFVQSVGPEVTQLKPGDLVLYDKYAEVGNRFSLLDDEGDLVDLIQMRLDNITAVMKRVKLDATP
jgi:co-chaperonin GroES (HSP10)